MAIPSVGRRFKPSEFEAYLASVDLTKGTFRPAFVTLHHTAAPSLKQRPTGFSDQHLRNLRDYYGKQLGWSGAPHLFVDDREDGIIVFQEMNKRGVHAVSFNRNSWGLEMLGQYDVEEFDSGRGLKVQQTTLQALAIMCKRLGVSAETIKFHRDDPKTSKTCPGTKVKKASIHSQVAALLRAPVPEDIDPSESWKEWKLFVEGTEFLPVHEHEGRPTVPIRKFWESAGLGGSLSLSADRKSVIWKSPAGADHSIAVATRDENGGTWALVRAFDGLLPNRLAVNGLELRF
jgi:hypothetical protein